MEKREEAKTKTKGKHKAKGHAKQSD